MDTRAPGCGPDSICSAAGPVELIYEKSSAGHRGYRFPRLDVPAGDAGAVPSALRRQQAPRLPEVTEPVVARHYVALSLFNHHVEKNLYPLGSCTMKYNPKINEELGRHPRFAPLHPEVPSELAQGMLALLWRLGEQLKAITGLPAVSLQPAAGAQGELLGMKLFRAYHRKQGNAKKTVLFPDSAHGTNPASVVLSGFTPRQIPSRADGRLDLEAFSAALDDKTAGVMITNPNTLGLFEPQMVTLAERVHALDGLVYMDGANLNALMGLSRVSELGVDVVHMNLHKTFSTPHGGGGPGAGPVAVSDRLEPFLPVPRIVRTEEGYALDEDRPDSVGRLHPFHGNVGVALRAYAYIRSLGADGLAAVTRAALVNANYLMRQVQDEWPVPKGELCMHEFVADAAWTRKHGVRNIDVAKRILDYGFHAPTVSFPLIVPDALMVEPTETETRATLDRFAAVLREIAREVRETPDVLRAAPTCTCVGRLDEAGAARRLNVRWEPQDGRDEG